MICFPFHHHAGSDDVTIAIYDEDNGVATRDPPIVAGASAFTPCAAAEKPAGDSPDHRHTKGVTTGAFPGLLLRKLDTFQTAPLQLILDGRNSDSAQIAANYLQHIVKNYRQELLEGKPKPDDGELVVRNWYNPNLDYKWFVVPSLIPMITTIGVMMVTSLSSPATVNKVRSITYSFRRSPPRRYSSAKPYRALIVATFQATIVLAIGIWAYQISFAGSLALFYFTMVVYGLSLVGFGSVI
ncbi:ABC transporter permease [Shigella sonnei]